MSRLFILIRVGGPSRSGADLQLIINARNAGHPLHCGLNAFLLILAFDSSAQNDLAIINRQANGRNLPSQGGVGAELLHNLLAEGAIHFGVALNIHS